MHGIHTMTAIPPLIMDENMLQLQTRCAAAEEKADDLRIELQAIQVQNAEGKIASLQRELEKSRTKIEETQEKLMEQTDLNEAMLMESSTLRSNNEKLEVRTRKFNSDLSKMKRAAQMDSDVMVGLKKQADTAKSELERLKRKRVDSLSPERIITGILQRPVDPPPSERLHTAKGVPPVSAQPTPKKSRTRKERWSDIHSSSAPHTSSNKDGVKEKKEHTSLTKKRDHVLYNSAYSFRRKQDIIDEIKESANTLGLSRSDTSFVFHRSMTSGGSSQDQQENSGLRGASHHLHLCTPAEIP
jgi:chromosome segregation ATPase